MGSAAIDNVIVLSSSSSGSDEVGGKKKAEKSKGSAQEGKEEKKPKIKAASSSSSSSPTTLGFTNGGTGTGSTSCSFPMSRVARLVRREGDSTLRITADAIFVINKASEMFTELFAQDAFANVKREHKKSVDYNHLSSIVHVVKRYEFLSDFIPEQVRAEDALKAVMASVQTEKYGL